MKAQRSFAVQLGPQQHTRPQSDAAAPFAETQGRSLILPLRHGEPPLEGITERLLADNLLTQVAHAEAVIAADPEARWASINANHMLPSGSSLFHPHLQGIVDSQPTTLQRMLVEVPAERFEAYLQTERRAGERYLGDTGRAEWLVSFAPIAPAELRAFMSLVALVATSRSLDRGRVEPCIRSGGLPVCSASPRCSYSPRGCERRPDTLCATRVAPALVIELGPPAADSVRRTAYQRRMTPLLAVALRERRRDHSCE